MTFSSAVMLTCLLQNLPGPPSFKYEEAVVQLLPINKVKCPDIDPNKDIKFEMFSAYNPTNSLRLYTGDDDALVRSRFNFSNPTMVFFHAFFEDSITPTSQAIKQGYLQLGGHNLIFVDATRLIAGPWYLTASLNTRVVGRYTARLIDYLVMKGLNLKSLHLIGLSLGAQMAGVCGHYIMSGRPGRITGLDPARPLFSNFPKSLRLDKTDADFVDIIHTDAGVFGYTSAMGHADFWPNKGVGKQPGCEYSDIKRRNPAGLFEPIFCSHWRAYIYYAESITKPNGFIAHKCKSWKDFEKRRCEKGKQTPMGLAASRKARGNYYLRTNPDYPYSLS